MEIDKNHRRTGLEHLESDIEVYNLLIDTKKRGDPVLDKFHIKLVDKDYPQAGQVTDKNEIYIARVSQELDTTNSNSATDEYERWNVNLQIIITIQQYDTKTASALLKTTYKAIKKALVNDRIYSYMTTTSIIPTFIKPGILCKYTINLKALELEEFDFETSDNLLMDLKLKASVDGFNSFENTIPSKNTDETEIPISHTNKLKSEVIGELGLTRG